MRQNNKLREFLKLIRAHYIPREMFLLFTVVILWQWEI